MELSTAINGYLLFKAARASAETIKTDRVMLRQFVEWTGGADIRDVTSNDIREYLAYHRDRGLSPHTIHRHHAILRAFYVWLSSDDIGLVDRNPVDGVPRPKLPKLKARALSKREVGALLGAVDRARCRRRAKALVLFLLDTGARVSEVTGVAMDDVDWKTGRVLVRGKGDKERYVYLGKRALSTLWLYVKDERPEPARVDGDFVFLDIYGDQMTRYNLRSTITRLAWSAGIKATPHQFRHTAAIEHLRHGMDLVSVQHLLGHEDIATTRGYLDALNDEDVEERARRTSPVDNWRL
jgi:site-specific recombinase XerD